MGDPIRQEIKIEGADQGARDLHEVADATRDVADATQKTTEKLEDHHEASRKSSESTRDAAATFAAFVATAAPILAFFDQLIEKATRAQQAMVKVGEGLEGLAGNIGGDLADQAYADLSGIALDRRLGPRGREQLVAAMGRATDIRPDMNRDDIKALGGTLADLQRATGVGGPEAFNTIEAIRATLGVDDATAANIAAVSLSSGFDPASLQDIVRRGGDMRTLGAMHEARKHGLDIAGSGRQMTSLLGSLSKTDDQGNLAPGLAALGITDEMSPMDRFARLVNMGDSGEISQGQFFAATGGESVSKLVRPLAAAMRDPGAIDAAVGELTGGGAIEELVTRHRASKNVRALEEERVTKLWTEVRKEASSLSTVGRRAAQMQAMIDDVGFSIDLPWIGDITKPAKTMAIALESGLSDEAAIEYQTQGMIDQAKRNLGLLPPDRTIPMSGLPGAAARAAGIEFQRPATVGGAASIINIINSHVGMKDVRELDSGRTKQE